MVQRQLGQDGRGVGRLGEAWIEGELHDDADVALSKLFGLIAIGRISRDFTSYIQHSSQEH